MYWAFNEKRAFFTSYETHKYNAWSCQKVCEAFTLLIIYFFRFAAKLYRQIAGIPMKTNCVPLVAAFFFIYLFILREILCYLSLSL